MIRFLMLNANLRQTSWLVTTPQVGGEPSGTTV
jgi:hypothetical protein